MKYSWQASYRVALLEFRQEALRQRIGEAEAAIRQRMTELRQDDSASAEERQALQDALQMLRSLAMIECPAPRLGVSGPPRDEAAS
jgi:hypothetical protein